MPFSDWPLWSNVAIFAAAAVIVYVAGTRLAAHADEIAERTQFSRVVLGMVLLGVVTSLPEIATTFTAAWMGNASLLAGNLFGGVAMQVAVLALVDAMAVRGALTYFAPQPVLLFQGVMLILLLAVALAGAAAGEPLAFGGVGVTPAIVALGYLATVRFSQGGDVLPPWKPLNPPEEPVSSSNAQAARLHDWSGRRLYTAAGLSALAILAAGWLLAQTGDALAAQTGLGSSFVGVALLAASTSLPEFSTALGAVRRGNHQMAISNILGTNCLEVALFLPADLVYRGGPLLRELDQSATFAAAMGLVVTAILLVGLLERRNRTVFGLGIDSLAVLSVYAAGLVGLYTMR
jgi:cation:H+ antiporter